jgi:hypothetical protein
MVFFSGAVPGPAAAVSVFAVAFDGRAAMPVGVGLAAALLLLLLLSGCC